MIHMNLIAVAEKNSSIGSVSQHLHVTNVADVERQYKRKYLTVAAIVVAAVLGLSGYLSMNGVPAALEGVFPDSYLNLIGAKSASTSKTASAGPTAEEIAKQKEALAKARKALVPEDFASAVPLFLEHGCAGRYRVLGMCVPGSELLLLAWCCHEGFFAAYAHG